MLYNYFRIYAKNFLRWLILLLLVGSAHASASEFDGTWKKICVNGVARTEEIAGDSATLHEDFYSDRFCQKEAMFRISSAGTFVVPETEKIDFTFANVFVTPLGEETTADYNARGVCGIQEWETMKPKAVSSLKCALFGAGFSVKMPSPGKMVFGIWRVEGDKLFLGELSNEQDGSAPEKRPRVFDSVPYTKVNPKH